MAGGYFWDTGDWELPGGASLKGVGGQAAIAFPDDFPPPKARTAEICKLRLAELSPEPVSRRPSAISAVLAN